ncbi:MAG: hypothetical protein LBP53_08760 [Candidatus Peribacteria bacterium]|nr:hypothetical protein [Candidatus Peribacteria bacterium]
MKKPALFVLFTCFLFLTACGPQPQSEITASSVAVPASGTVASSYAYTWKMLQPSVIDMTNRTAMNEGFHEQRTTGYVLSTGEVDRRKAECPEITILTEGLSTPKDSPSLATVLSSSKLVAGATIPLTGYWNAKSMINLSDTEKQQVATRGRTIVGIDRLNSRYPISYAKEDSSDMAYSEEWATIYDKI